MDNIITLKIVWTFLCAIALSSALIRYLKYGFLLGMVGWLLLVIIAGIVKEWSFVLEWMPLIGLPLLLIHILLFALVDHQSSSKKSSKRFEVRLRVRGRTLVLDNIRRGVSVMASAGSGKTEMLISIAYNALLQASGFIYVDGKGDNGLYAKVFSMVRSMGREDDMLLINFMTGARDIIGPQQKRLSNTLNPFAKGSFSLLFFEISSSTEWQSPNNGPGFIPNWYVDITSTLDKKKQALEIYNSEMREWPHARSIKGIEYLAYYRGASVGLEAAESFIAGRVIC
mgnify:CR=1 FL=1